VTRGNASYSIGSRKILDQRVASLKSVVIANAKGAKRLDHITVSAGLFVRRTYRLESIGERGDETGAGTLDPWRQAGHGLAPDRHLEFGDDLAGLDEGRYASFDRRDRDGLRLREQVPPDGHEARDRSGRRNPLKVLGVGPFCPSSAGRPLADDAERASEATRRQASPEFSAISTAGSPLIVEPRQMQVHRTLPGPEDIVAFAADHLPYQLPAVAALAYDLLDGYAILRRSQNGRIGLLAAEVALILEALRGCEQRGIDRGSADHGAYPAHQFSNSIKESPARHQMPVDQPAEVLEPYLDRLSLVAVNFPTFRDGPGFTQARSLREHLAFSGEIRATGNILPDQYTFLLRCGITTVETPDGTDAAAWQKAADRFSFAYQTSVLKEPVLSGLRRTIRLGVPTSTLADPAVVDDLVASEARASTPMSR
jgi:uncharacterized protein (DUF934 family)